jgi:hypothetical protein
MPIPMEIYMPTDYTNERFLEYCDSVELKWCLWPRRCHVSNKWLWLTTAYLATYIIRGPGALAIWTRWYSNKEMLWLKLKGVA